MLLAAWVDEPTSRRVHLITTHAASSVGVAGDSPHPSRQTTDEAPYYFNPGGSFAGSSSFGVSIDATGYEQ
jgi:hypothetical protein